MTLTLNLPPEMEAGLLAQAEAQGLSLQAYLERMIQEQFRTVRDLPLSLQEWASELDAWVNSFPADTPLLSDESLRQETIYPDRW